MTAFIFAAVWTGVRYHLGRLFIRRTVHIGVTDDADTTRWLAALHPDVQTPIRPSLPLGSGVGGVPRTADERWLHELDQFHARLDTALLRFDRAVQTAIGPEWAERVRDAERVLAESRRIIAAAVASIELEAAAR